MRNAMLIGVVGLAALLVCALPVRAEGFAGVPDRVWADIGGAVNDLSTNFSATGPNGVGASVNFEDVFNLPGSKTTFRLQGTVRVTSGRSHVDFGYVDIKREASRVIQRDVEWGDYTFQAGATITAHFDTQFIYGAYRYDFLHEDKIMISGSAGISYMTLGAGLAADGHVLDPNGEPIEGSINKDESIGAPVPVIGLNLDWALTRRLILRGYNRLIRVKIGNVDGGYYESGIHVNWYFVKNVGVGVGIDKTDLRINELTLSSGDKAKANYSIAAAGVYLTLAF